MKKDIIIGALLLILGIVIGLLCRPKHFRDEVKMFQTDTIVRFDTIVVEKPTLVERTYYDSLYIAVRDTIRIKDSIYVPIPIEKKIYKGEDYLAEISGYKASLDRIEVYPKTTTITQMQSVTKCNTLALGFEMQYNRYASIPIYLEYSHLLHKNVARHRKDTALLFSCKQIAKIIRLLLPLLRRRSNRRRNRRNRSRSRSIRNRSRHRRSRNLLR